MLFQLYYSNDTAAALYQTERIDKEQVSKDIVSAYDHGLKIEEDNKTSEEIDVCEEAESYLLERGVERVFVENIYLSVL